MGRSKDAKTKSSSKPAAASGRRELSPFQNKVFWTLMAVAVCCGMLSLISVIEESVDLGRFAPYTGQAKAFVVVLSISITRSFVWLDDAGIFSQKVAAGQPSSGAAAAAAKTK